jgi:hypothetical protein
MRPSSLSQLRERPALSEAKPLLRRSSDPFIITTIAHGPQIDVQFDEQDARDLAQMVNDHFQKGWGFANIVPREAQARERH